MINLKFGSNILIIEISPPLLRIEKKKNLVVRKKVIKKII